MHLPGSQRGSEARQHLKLGPCPQRVTRITLCTSLSLMNCLQDGLSLKGLEAFSAVGLVLLCEIIE